MGFVSLVTVNNEIYGKLRRDFFEDVKLTGLLHTNVLRVMEKLPVKEDILLRQETFAYLENESVRSHLTELFYELCSLKEVFEAYFSADNDKEKHYIFSTLLHLICGFYEKASTECADSGFLNNFSLCFKKLVRTKEFDSVKKDAEEIYNKRNNDFFVFVASNETVITKEPKEGYIKRIERCADEMGIKLSECDYISRRISPEFTESLSRLSPEYYRELSSLYSKYKDYPDADILAYIDELDFYLSVYALTERVRALGIPTCYAKISDFERIRITEAYDITLLAKECESIIPNDVIFDNNDPFFFLSGANGGGKTTYLRTCGVSTLFSLLGCPVPARTAAVCMLDSIGSHFPRDERFDCDGRFHDEQKRVDILLSDIGKKSLVLLNETYSTTNEAKAAEMTVALAKELDSKGQFGVYVTHQKSVLKESIPLLSCKVDKDDENKRTYKIERINSIGSSYAEDVLKKYALSLADLEERFGELS
ncbi:MAG: hypothetical protein E7591_09580 [Ruminococcaceae bacterium]|nr:hypothetical protein [Oscillospiraceae bacterium]